MVMIFYIAVGTFGQSPIEQERSHRKSAIVNRNSKVAAASRRFLPQLRGFSLGILRQEEFSCEEWDAAKVT